MNIEIRGLDELIERFGQVATNEVLRRPMQRAMYRIQRDMADYPPQKRNTGYRRTGTLGRRWTTDVRSDHGGLTGRVGNNTEYGPWVQSERFQAWMHRDYWQTDEEVLEYNEDRIVDDFERAVVDALRE